MPEDNTKPNPDWITVPQGEINGFEMRNGKWAQVRYIMKDGKITEASPDVDSLPRYIKANPDEYWWCNVHERRATHILQREGMEDHHDCDPDLGGITMPCRCVRLDEIVDVNGLPK